MYVIVRTASNAELHKQWKTYDGDDCLSQPIGDAHLLTQKYLIIIISNMEMHWTFKDRRAPYLRFLTHVTYVADFPSRSVKDGRLQAE